MKNLALLVLMLCLAACDGDFTMSDVTGKWQLSTMKGQLAPADMRAGGVTLEIQEDGKFAGQAPVNRYFGQINAQDKTFKTGPPELMDAERDFFAVINDVKSVDVKGGQLTLTGPDGKRLVFERVE